ncbi:MAG: ABC transporter substrate-binding protein, partial [Candidatus Omnitrophica bacterium]|nr:ABC transporter substrate-binding protein [Candidatus Omnitrophota bacterium]
MVTFAINGNQLDDGKTHFEQVSEKAGRALKNAQATFNYANQAAHRLRDHQEVVHDFGLNVLEQDLGFVDKLIKYYGTPYTDDIGTNKTYPIGYEGPDLYHYDYVDASPLLGEDAAETVEFDLSVLDHELMIERIDDARIAGKYDILGDVRFEAELEDFFEYELDDLNPEEDDNSKEISLSVSTRGLGLIKPETWVGNRHAYGQLQLDRADLVQKYGEMLVAVEEYNEYLYSVDRAYGSLTKNLSYMIASHEAETAAHEYILAQRIGIHVFESLAKNIEFVVKRAEAGAKIAEKAAKDAENPVFVTSFTGAIQAAVGTAFEFIISVLEATTTELELAAKQLEISIDSQEHELDELLASLNIDSTMKTFLKEYALLVNEAERRALVMKTSVEAYIAAQHRYQATLGEAERALDQFLAYRRRVAATVSKQRYDDLGFRIFRNDALEDFELQLELASRYVFLAAKAYDYETNLLAIDPLAGQQFLNSIIREDFLGAFDPDTGEPLVTGSGLAAILARMNQNFDTAIRPALGFDNPDVEANLISLRWELFRIPLEEEYDDLWEETLLRYVVDDLRTVPAFREHCLSGFPPDTGEPQPAIVLRFPTMIETGKNFFGHPLGRYDNNFASDRFATKIRRYDIWLSNYEQTAGPADLTSTPRVFFVPIGRDVMRVPTVHPGEPRYWSVLDQILPMPFPIETSALLDLIDFDVWDSAFGSGSSLLTRNRYGSLLANEVPRLQILEGWQSYIRPDYVAGSRAIGRSVWNSEWMVVIPGSNLSADPVDGINGFIYGDGSEESGVKDIHLFFDTYSYAGAIRKSAPEKGEVGMPNLADMDAETEDAYRRADAKLTTLKGLGTGPTLVDSESEMPPMLVYGKFSSAEDGGLVTDGQMEVLLRPTTVGQTVVESGDLANIAGLYSYNIAVPVEEAALSVPGRLRRGTLYQSEVTYIGDIAQSTSAILPAADYGKAVRMPDLALSGVDTGNPTFTPTPTPTPGGQDPTPTPTPTPWPRYLVYASQPISGFYSDIGQEAFQGAQLAVEDINRNGGIGGVPVEMMSLDNQSRVLNSINQIQTAIADPDAFGIIGGELNDNALSMAPYASNSH